MRRLIQISTITFAFFLFSSYVFADQFKVTWVYDGDTFKAKGHDIEIVVRLIAIDAPEISHAEGEPSQPFSIQAKRMLTHLILNKSVNIKGYGLDKHNRLLAVVSYRGKNIGVEMIRQGLAEIYQGQLPDNLDLKDYNRAEFQAKTSKKGIWTQGNDYVSPREWRGR